jgi:hypothetical protein
MPIAETWGNGLFMHLASPQNDLVTIAGELGSSDYQDSPSGVSRRRILSLHGFGGGGGGVSVADRRAHQPSCSRRIAMANRCARVPMQHPPRLHDEGASLRMIAL